MQKTLYLGVILAGIVVVLSGLAIWKPVQFQELTALFGGYDAARYVHFFAMAAIVGFLVVACAGGAAGAEKHPRHDPRPVGGHPCASATSVPGVDTKLLIKDAAKLLPDPARRQFLRGAGSLGALTFLTGCDIVDSNAAEGTLRMISKFNDRVQAAIFNPNKLAPTYPESAITKPFPFNAYYSEDDAPEVDGATYKLEVAGLVDNKKPWTLEELYALPQEKQITRHICVEGWSAIGSWTGVRLSDFLAARRRRHAREIRLSSSAPRAIPTPSTWRRRCIRRRR